MKTSQLQESKARKAWEAKLFSSEYIRLTKDFINDSREDSDIPIRYTVFYTYEDDGSTGYRLVEAKSVAEAILRAILADFENGYLDGLSLVQKLKRQPTFVVKGWHIELLQVDYPIPSKELLHLDKEERL